VAEIDVGRLKAELIAGGYSPQRFAFLVRRVRRVLWPLVRPYHFFTLEALGRERAAILGELAAILGELDGRLQRLIEAQSALRTEVAAAVNRQAAIESELDRRTAAMESRLAAIAGELSATAERANIACARVELGHQRLDALDQRTRVTPAVARHGLMLLKAGDYASDVVARTGEWDHHITAVMDEVARTRQGAAVDVGAHIGLLTVAMARRFTRVLSFEPNRFNYALLVANVALNALGNVRCVNGALFSRAADLSLATEAQQEIPVPLRADGDFDGTGASNLGAYVFSEQGSGLFATHAVTLDSLRLDDLAFLKIDAQGADGEVITGAAETIRRCRPVIVFEWEALLSRHFSVSLEEVTSLLSSASYRLEVLKVHNEKQTDYLARPG